LGRRGFFGIDYEDAFKYIVSEFGSFDVNSLVSSAMHLILERIVQEVEGGIRRLLRGSGAGGRKLENNFFQS